MLKTFKYKLQPNNQQIILLNKHFGSTRFVFNYFLNQRKTEYHNNKKTLNYYDNANELTILKNTNEYSWLKEINSQSLQTALKNLDGAYNNFFKFNKGFPRFKSKNDNKNSFTIPQYVKLKNNELIIPKFKDGIKVIIDRKFTGNIKYCTITKTCTNEYFVSILVDTTHIKLPKTGLSVGIDLGIKDFVITSDGYKYKNNRYTKQYQTKLKIQQQHLSRKTKGSNRYNKQKLKVAFIHKKITNSRMDNLHKVSTELIKKYDNIILEDLNIKGMIKNHKLSKHINDVSWGKFIELLSYKALWNDKVITKINRFYPSSKTCNHCGYINQNLTLNDRMWTCPHCYSKLDRDLNASINILKEGLRNISSGTDDYRRGDKIRPVLTGIIDESSKIQINISETPIPLGSE